MFSKTFDLTVQFNRLMIYVLIQTHNLTVTVFIFCLFCANILVFPSNHRFTNKNCCYLDPYSTTQILHFVVSLVFSGVSQNIVYVFTVQKC